MKNDHKHLADQPKPESKGTLGTFAGVFTPSVLTILGIILFLRLGFVVGNTGLGKALLMLALANGISVLTSVSLSAIAFGLIHWSGGFHSVVITSIIGAVFMLLYLKTNSLPGVMAAHFIVNFIDFATFVPKSLFRFIFMV